MIVLRRQCLSVGAAWRHDLSKSEEIHLIYPANILFSLTQKYNISSLIYEKKALLKIPVFLLDSDDPGVILRL